MMGGQLYHYRVILPGENSVSLRAESYWVHENGMLRFLIGDNVVAEFQASGWYGVANVTLIEKGASGNEEDEPQAEGEE